MSSIREDDPRLVDACAELFLFVTTLRRNAPAADFDKDTVRKSLIRIIDNAEADVQRFPDLRKDWESAKYAIVALADEVALHADWDGADTWELDLLEQHYFGRAMAGQEFYDRIEKLPPGNDQLAEVYFRCLSLGFKGRYRNRPEERQEMQQRLYRSLPGRLTSTNVAVSPTAMEHVHASDMTKIPIVSAARLVVITLGAIVLAYIAAWMITDHQVEKFSEANQQLRESLKKE